MKQTFFISDTHWYHHNVIRYSNRPFKDVEEMNYTMIKNWNDTVAPDDDVYHLGDFAFAGDDTIKAILSQLSGNKYFIFGNHDKSLVKNQNTWGKDHFVKMRDMLKIKVQDKDAPGGVRQIVLCHYSLRVWDGSHKGAWNLYGHSHGNLFDDPKLLSMDVGVDATRLYRPISYGEVKAHMAKKTWGPVDHHGAD